MLYSDGQTEAPQNGLGPLRGPRLLEVASSLPTGDPRDTGSARLHAIAPYAPEGSPEDDGTVMVLRCAHHRRIPGIRERLAGFSKAIGLSAV